MKKILILIPLTLLSANLFAQNDLGDTYYSQKDYEKALVAYMPQAEQGDAYAQNKVGECYREMVNYEKAVEYFKLSSKQGFALGQRNLGYCYDYSLGVSHEPREAVSLYENAYKQGCLEAYADYAYMLVNSEGGVRDQEEKGVAIFKEGIAKNDPACMSGLGSCFKYGRTSLPKNEVMALRWFLKAANMGDPVGQYQVGLCHFKGTAGLEANDKEAAKWFQMSAEQGNRTGQNYLATYYYNHEQYPLAFDWFLKSAKRCDPNSQMMVGVMYAYGQGVVKNVDSAGYWFEKSARQEYKKGYDWYEWYDNIKTVIERAEEGYTDYQIQLAEYYLEGNWMVPKDKVKALEWLEMAALAGDTHACRILGDNYSGRDKKYGLPINLQNALRWFKLGGSKDGEWKIYCQSSYETLSKNGLPKTPTEKKYDER